MTAADLITLAAMTAAAILAGTFLVRELRGPRPIWDWKRNEARRFGADLAYWWTAGPDGRSIALTEEAVAEARERAEKLGGVS